MAAAPERPSMKQDWQRLGQRLGGSPGLCQSCTHARLITSDRNSIFLLCEAHVFNPRLAKYPALPVWTCESYDFDHGHRTGRPAQSGDSVIR